jgi:hypothetical protein
MNGKFKFNGNGKPFEEHHAIKNPPNNGPVA